MITNLIAPSYGEGAAAPQRNVSEAFNESRSRGAAGRAQRMPRINWNSSTAIEDDYKSSSIAVLFAYAVTRASKKSVFTILALEY